MENLDRILAGLSVNAHSSVRLELDGRVLYVDPFRLETAPHDADLIFATHDHFDHFSPEDIARVSRPDSVFVLPESCRESCAPVIGARPAVFVRPGEAGQAAGVEFEAVPAYNPAKPFHPRAKGWVGYVLLLRGLRLYVAGDSDATPEAAAVRCDVALLPIGGKYTMDAPEAAALANRLRPRVVIPIHYGSVAGSPADFERFAAAVDPELRVLKLV